MHSLCASALAEPRALTAIDSLESGSASATAFEPDALVYGGAPIAADAIEVPAPIIVVEVISPRSQYIDTGLKLRGYFQVPSVTHYLGRRRGEA